MMWLAVTQNKLQSLHTENTAERHTSIKKNKAISVNTWNYIVIPGEIDFSDFQLEDSQYFAFERMHAIDILSTS